MNKGIVMEMTAKSLVVMTPSGQFKRVSRLNRPCQIGEEIDISVPSAMRLILSSRTAHTALSAAAAILLLVVVSLGIFGGGNSVVAYLSMDINPSVELGIDMEEKVVQARGLNEDGQQLLKSVEYKGKMLDVVTESLMEAVERQQFLAEGEGDIVITSTIIRDSSPLDEEQLNEIVKAQVTKAIQAKQAQKAQNIVVTTLAAPKELREEALEKGVSTGKLAVKLLANKANHPVDLEELQKHSIHEIVGSMGGMKKLLEENPGSDKETLKKLLKAAQDNEKRLSNQKRRVEDTGESKDKGKDKAKAKEKKIEDRKVEKDAKDNRNNGNDRYENRSNNQRSNDKSSMQKGSEDTSKLYDNAPANHSEQRPTLGQTVDLSNFLLKIQRRGEQNDRSEKGDREELNRKDQDVPQRYRQDKNRMERNQQSRDWNRQDQGQVESRKINRSKDSLEDSLEDRLGDRAGQERDKRGREKSERK